MHVFEMPPPPPATRHLDKSAFPHTIQKTEQNVPNELAKQHTKHQLQTWLWSTSSKIVSVLSSPGGSHVGPMNLAIRDYFNPKYMPKVIAILCESS